MLHSIFSKSLISYRKTLKFDELLLDFLKESDFLKKFYDFTGSTKDIKRRIETYQNPRLDRLLLKNTIAEQYQKSGIKSIPNLVSQNINSLENGNTFTVCAGHQLNIFSGPLYVIFKLISTISLSKKLNSLFPSNHFVPVYWMATEDHDINEIDSVNLFGKKYEWEHSWKGISGNMPIQGLESLINNIKNTFGNSKYATELSELIEQSYLTSQTLGEATRKWINALLGFYGLVIIDGHEMVFKSRVKDIFLDEVTNQTTKKLVDNSISQLSEKYNAQAKPREINLFYLGKDYRERLVKEDNRFQVLNTDITFSLNQLTDEISNFPDRFSPNVLLRPLYQESILPNVAFLGGPAEIAYWLELKDLFNNYHVPFPALILRNCATIINKSTNDKLSKFSISDKEIFLSTDELIKNFMLNSTEEKIDFNVSLDRISNELSNIGHEVSKIDATLNAFVEGEKQKIKSSFLSLEEKILRVQKKKKESELNQIRKIKDQLFPNGGLQEREESLIPHFLNHGKSFFDMLLENFDPFEKEFMILKEVE